MKNLLLVATVALSAIVAGLGSDAEAARGCRPVTRRCCVGVTHQPCLPASVRAPRCQTAVDDGIDCTCAFFDMGGMGGVHYYYSVHFYPDCNTGRPVMMMGNFLNASPDPCPTCPSSQCLSMPFYASQTPGRLFKPGTKLKGPLNWDEKLVLKSGQAKIKGRTFEFESKELTDANMLVSFTKGNTLHFAKLQVYRVEAQELGGTKTSTVSDFAIGQEIVAPPADQKIRDVTSQVKILDPNVAEIRIGNTTYQVVTATPLSERGE